MSSSTAERTEQKLDWQQLLTDAMTLPGNTLGVYNRFTTYSFLNTLFLYSQGAREPVATFNLWKELGRNVLKGEKALSIVRPINVKREHERTGEEVRYTRFKVVRCLFQLSQTAGAELPPAPDPPEWSLDRALTALDIKRVPFDHIDGNAQGFSHDRNIAISPIAVYPLKTTMHEIGHILQGHTTDDQAMEYVMHRGVKEFEAEGTAYLAMNELDMMTDEQATVSRGYLQEWMRGQQPAESSIRGVFRATDMLLKAGRPAVEAAISEVA